jgi:hypothetical protein
LPPGFEAAPERRATPGLSSDYGKGRVNDLARRMKFHKTDRIGMRFGMQVLQRGRRSVGVFAPCAPAAISRPERDRPMDEEKCHACL